MSRKPPKLRFDRNLDTTMTTLACECLSWRLSEKDFGRAVTVPGLCFDEEDAKRIRKLSDWLRSAADWLEGRK